MFKTLSIVTITNLLCTVYYSETDLGLLQHPRWSALWWLLTAFSRWLLSQSTPSWMLQQPQTRLWKPQVCFNLMIMQSWFCVVVFCFWLNFVNFKGFFVKTFLSLLWRECQWKHSSFRKVLKVIVSCILDIIKCFSKIKNARLFLLWALFHKLPQT